MSDIPALDVVLESAARLQRLVPDAVVVGGTAAAFHVRHRMSYDHDHVVADLRNRFDVVFDALEREGDWVTNRTSYGKLILDQLGGIETGVRQLIRARPLETEVVQLGNGASLTVPTLEETLRIKGFLIVKRNQTRDYLDVAALGDFMGTQAAGRVLAGIDAYYADQQPPTGSVATQLATQLAYPQPRDHTFTERLSSYKGLLPRWSNWNQITTVCSRLADAMMDASGHTPHQQTVLDITRGVVAAPPTAIRSSPLGPGAARHTRGVEGRGRGLSR